MNEVQLVLPENIKLENVDIWFQDETRVGAALHYGKDIHGLKSLQDFDPHYQLLALI